MRPNAIVFKYLTVGFLSLVLGACGSGISTTPGSSGGGGGGTTTTTAAVEIGSGSASTFQKGTLLLSTSSISAGGTATVSASLVDANNANALYNAAATVSFSSICSGKGQASFNPAQQLSASGSFSSTYTASGCAQTDTITASATINGQPITANANINVAPATIGSIQFIGALPTTIGLQGMGGITSSKVTFQVNDANGNPISGASVSFSLNPTVGGTTLNPLKGTTDNLGQVFTFVQSGAQHGVINVKATVTLAGVTSSISSSAITISTGVPTQNNFSMSMDTHNLEGFNVDGEIATITVRMSDRFQNPVPDGTAVTFTTNGGAVDGQCFTFTTTTESGLCTVHWVSKNPRPVTDTDDVQNHVHILAYTVGEESFIDKNGNGVFDATDSFAGDDIPEVFMDSKETGSYVSGEYYVDFDNSGTHTGANGKWDGQLCKAGASCGNPTVEISGETCLVMSTSGLNITGPTTVPAGTTAAYTIQDGLNNVPAQGTIISLIGAPSGAVITESGNTSFAVTDLPGACSATGITIHVVIPTGTTVGSTFSIQAVSPVSNQASTSAPITTS